MNLWTTLETDVCEVAEGNGKDEFLAASRFYQEVLAPIDGVRGTWRWASREPTAGESPRYGLVPWVIDPICWCCTNNPYEVVEPYLIPAFVQYTPAPGCVYEHLQPGVPIASITAICEFSGTSLEYCEGLKFRFLNSMRCDNMWMECYFAVPIWHITPLGDETAIQWSATAKRFWAPHNTWVHEYIGHDESEYHNDECRWKQIWDGFYRSNGHEARHAQAPFDTDCTCGLISDVDEYIRNTQDGSFFPHFDDPNFADVWRWAVTRYFNAWAAFVAYEPAKDDNSCQYSSVWSLAPFLRISQYEDFPAFIERSCSIPSMNSQQLLDYLPEPSQQLTLFAS